MKEKTYFLKSWRESWKTTGLLMVFTFFIGILSDLCILIPAVYAQIILLIVCLALFGLMMFMLSKSAGETAYKAKLMGELRREHENNLDERSSKYKPWTEYKFYKGILIGANMSAILALVVLIGVIFPGADGGCRLILVALFGNSISFVSSIASTVLVEGEVASIAWNLIYVVFPPLFSAAGYCFGAEKIRAQRRKIDEKTRTIYGD